MKVEVCNINFGYDNSKNILENISFSVNSSENLAILGTSGCGKSTLLRIVCGLLPNSTKNQFSGNVFIDNKDISKHTNFWLEERSKGHIGFMFQAPELLPFLSVEDNIALSLDIIKQKSKDKVKEFLGKTELELHKDKLPHQLSGGMRTRVALARTFITNPKVLFLDEPFSSLDIIWKSRLYEELRNLKKISNSTIVLVTHDIFEAIYFSKTIIVLGKNGSMVSSYIVNNWREDLSYNDIIKSHYNDFIYIKGMIDYNL